MAKLNKKDKKSKILEEFELEDESIKLASEQKYQEAKEDSEIDKVLSDVDKLDIPVDLGHAEAKKAEKSLNLDAIKNMQELKDAVGDK